MSFKNFIIKGVYNQILSLNETIIQKCCEDIFRFYHTWRISKKISNNNQEDNTGTTDISVSVKKQSWIAKRLWGTPNIDRCILHIKKKSKPYWWKPNWWKQYSRPWDNERWTLTNSNVIFTKTKLLTFVHNDQQSIIKRLKKLLKSVSFFQFFQSFLTNVIKICSL